MKYYIDNYVCLQNCIKNINKDPVADAAWEVVMSLSHTLFDKLQKMTFSIGI
jgi:hypothetical protein